jgi:hypothetical protein
MVSNENETAFDAQKCLFPFNPGPVFHNRAIRNGAAVISRTG